MIRLNYDQWYALFQPLEDEEGTLIEIEFDETERINQLIAERRIWTDDHYDIISEGAHFVNRMRYLETAIPYPVDLQIEVSETGQIPTNYYFMVEKYDRFLLHHDTRGLPYIFWDIQDANDWADDHEEENLRQNYVLIDADGDMYDWEGGRLDD